jgi:hypothetical protein
VKFLRLPVPVPGGWRTVKAATHGGYLKEPAVMDRLAALRIRFFLRPSSFY